MNMAQRRMPIRFGTAAVYSLLLAYFVVTVFPMVWLCYTSVKPSAEVFLEPFALPVDPAWSNYAGAWEAGRLGGGLFNSVAVTLVSVGLTVFLGAMAGYALSRFIFPGARAVLFFFIGGLMVPLQLAVVPLFFELRAMELLNSRVGLVLVYVATGLPFAVFIMTGFFRSLPAELHESALLDGAGQWGAFRYVMLPLAKPGLITVAIFTFLGVWHEYFLAFMFLSGEGSRSVRTLPLGLAELTIASQYRTDWGAAFAGIVMVMLPTLVVYVLLQRHLREGVTVGAVKG